MIVKKMKVLVIFLLAVFLISPVNAALAEKPPHAGRGFIDAGRGAGHPVALARDADKGGEGGRAIAPTAFAVAMRHPVLGAFIFVADRAAEAAPFPRRHGPGPRSVGEAAILHAEPPAYQRPRSARQA